MLLIHRLMELLIYRIVVVPKTASGFTSRFSKRSYGDLIENNFLREVFHTLYL